MRAELVVKYEHGDLINVLARRYGPHNPAALEASELWRQAHKSVEEGVAYAARTAKGLIVMAWSANGTGEVFVESSTGRLRSCSEQVWDAIREEGKQLTPKPMRPKLHSLELVDLPGDVVATASVGVASILHDQLLGPIVTGLVTGIVLLISVLLHSSEHFVYGSMTAIVIAILSLARLIWSSRHRRLAWR